MSEKERKVALVCTQETFRPVPTTKVRWLKQEEDYPLWAAFTTHWEVIGREPTQELWDDVHRLNTRFSGIVEKGCLLSMAAATGYSESAWELSGVYTQPNYRRQGYSKTVCSFVTAYILDHVEQATCHTRETNAPMLAVAERLGYRIIET